MSNRQELADDLYFASCNALGVPNDLAEELLEHEVRKFGRIDGLISARRLLVKRKLQLPSAAVVSRDQPTI